MKAINEKGLAEIAAWLAANHKRPADVAGREEAWAFEAEQSMRNGNPPLIEIRAKDSVSGFPETFTVPVDGISRIRVSDGWFSCAECGTENHFQPCEACPNGRRSKNGV